jgi:hypothetical protein
MKCTDLLFQDHIIILRALEILDRMGASFGKNEPVDPEDIRDILRFQHASLRQMLFEHDLAWPLPSTGLFSNIAEAVSAPR